MIRREFVNARWRLGVGLLVALVTGGGFAPLFFVVRSLVPGAHGLSPAAAAALSSKPAYLLSWFVKTMPQLITVYALILVLGSVVGEATGGSITWLLMLPRPRWWIILHKQLAASLEVGLVALAALAALWTGGSVAFGRLPPGMIGASLLGIADALAIEAVIGFVGIWFLTPIAVVVAVAVLFAFSIIAQIAPALDVLHVASARSFLAGTIPWSDLAVMLAAGALAVTCSVLVFQRKELW